ncbi:fatty acyl-AMP ligase [Pendulispora rubella]|uniref:Fatty acyl-AMP ligase n=1 Tax=Pendulispora rubella TaxID=2741070 RepID=A0ABZ2LF14_9BACT
MPKNLRYRSLVDLTIRRSRESGGSSASAYTFLLDGEDEAESIDYAELGRRARRIAVGLRGSQPGDRALLIFPPGLDFIAAFIGCLHAKVIAVPAYPPTLARLARGLPRLQAIAANSGANVVLTTQPILGLVEMIAPHAPDLAKLKWIAVDALPEGSEAEWDERAGSNIGPSDVAFLQYTSGSTGAPKGVVVTHGNLLANLECTYEACFRGASDSVYVGWLPPYHDMGLIGQLLQPLYAGYPCVTMSPLHFLQRPLRWLRAITKYRGTTSASPNFAFDLCSRKVSPQERASLDLSSWSVVFNGAEPINAATLRTFSELFGPCGFRSSSFFPCYGLAEATLMVSGGERQGGYRTLDVDADVLEAGRAVPFTPADDHVSRKARTLVAVGKPVGGHEVAIVDDAGQPVGPGVVGELLISGPSVAQGYWGDAESSVFEGNRLRSGDLGFAGDDGDLFVTGRRKDLIIIRGRNLFPQDLEAVVEAAHPSIRRGCSAAFSTQPLQGQQDPHAEREEQLIIVAEVERAPKDPTTIVAAIHKSIADEFAVRPAEVLLLKAATIPKTSSGKLRRFQCRIGHRDKTLDVVHRG